MNWRRLAGSILLFGILGGFSVASADSRQFKVEAITLTVEQYVTPGITYHTKEEMEALLKEKVAAMLGQKSLLSDREDAAKLIITAHYVRRFVGDMTPVPSDALAYPEFRYKIEVTVGGEPVATVEKDELTYAGGFAMNMKVVAAALRDKSYEVEFVEGLAKGIVEEVDDLR